MKEEFKYITLHDVKLKVSNLGKVYKEEVELKQNINHDDYKVVYVGNNRSVGVHRIVALAFIDNNVPERNEVNHLDFNRQNNRVDNLKWVTHQENIEYSKLHGRYKMKDKSGNNNPNFGNTKLSDYYKANPEEALKNQSRKGIQNGKSKPIKLYKDGILIKEFPYIGECCEYLHLNHGFSDNYETIRIGIRRSVSKNKPYKGFTFEK